MKMRIQTRILVGGSSAYCIIITPTGTLDVKLMAGKSASASLRESASWWRQDARDAIARAELAEAAADHLEGVS